jgi:hypothetical protein
MDREAIGGASIKLEDKYKYAPLRRKISGEKESKKWLSLPPLPVARQRHIGY